MIKPLPPRDWKAHWYSYLGHWFLGVLVAAMILNGAIASGFAILICYLVYQYVEFKRRGDTPARDVADFMVGLVPVLVLRYCWMEGLGALVVKLADRL